MEQLFKKQVINFNKDLLSWFFKCMHFFLSFHCNVFKHKENIFPKITCCFSKGLVGLLYKFKILKKNFALGSHRFVDAQLANIFLKAAYVFFRSCRAKVKSKESDKLLIIFLQQTAFTSNVLDQEINFTFYLMIKALLQSNVIVFGFIF